MRQDGREEDRAVEMGYVDVGQGDEGLRDDMVIRRWSDRPFFVFGE